MRPPHPQRPLVLLAAVLAGAPVVFAAAPPSDSDKWIETLQDVKAETPAPQEEPPVTAPPITPPPVPFPPES